MAVHTLIKTKFKLNAVIFSKHIKTFAFTDCVHSRGITRQLIKGSSLLPCHGATATAILSRNNPLLSVIPTDSLAKRQLCSHDYNYPQWRINNITEFVKMAHITGDLSSTRAFAAPAKDSHDSKNHAPPVAETTNVNANANLSTKEKLKQAVKDYGSTVLVFHITMSLASLGICYALVSSGLDVASLLEKVGIGQAILESKLTQGASTFVVAYAIHKLFAPVRVTITLTATPFIVKYLRRVGVLKIKPVKTD